MSFGHDLKRLRVERGWTQQQMASALGGLFARSTVANIEDERERPSPHFWEVLISKVPEWTLPLQNAYETASSEWRNTHPIAARHRSRWAVAGPFVVELLQVLYVYGHSRAVEEIQETRRVRAIGADADSYVMHLHHPGTDRLVADAEALWGGEIGESHRIEANAQTTLIDRVDFGTRIRRGETHEFAIRRWIGRDPNPLPLVAFALPVPTETVAIRVKFRGPDKPTAARSFGPLDDISQLAGAKSAAIAAAGEIEARFVDPDVGALYGVAWDWPAEPTRKNGNGSVG